MSILYKKAVIKNDKNTKNGYTYGRAVVLSTVSTKDLAEEISHSTTVTRADVMAVLIEACVAIKNHLLNSDAVKLDELGTFKPALKTVAIKEDDDTKFGVNQIKGAKINYLPATYFTPTGVNEKGNRTGYRTKLLVQGATFKNIEDVSGSAGTNSSSSSSSGTQTNP